MKPDPDPLPIDFSGFWDWQLTIVAKACPGDESGTDCFQIQQNDEGDLLIIDNSGGNLTGALEDGEAVIIRDTVVDRIELRLTLSDDRQTAEGIVSEEDKILDCVTVLDVVGTRRTERCHPEIDP